MKTPLLLFLVLLQGATLFAATPSRFVVGCLTLFGRAIDTFASEIEIEPLKGIPEHSNWLTSNPELRQRLEKVRSNFLKMRERELSTRTDIPHLKQIDFKGSQFPVSQFLGAGFAGDGSVYVARDGEKDRIFKVFRNRERFESHQRYLKAAEEKGVPIVKNLAKDESSLTIELEGKIGVSVDVLGYDAVETYGLSLVDIQFIQEAYRTQFEIPYGKKTRVEWQNVLLELSTGRFYLLDPH